MRLTNILLASHGTEGARAAEQAALMRLEAGGTLHHLEIVPDFWKGMMGDDWLNNAITRIRYGEYVEGELTREVAENAQRIDQAAAARGVACFHHAVVGKPAEALLEQAARGGIDRVVIGSPRPKGALGYNSRMAVETLVKALRVPLLIIPHPQR